MTAAGAIAIGRRVREARGAMTRAELGARCGLSEARLYQIETAWRGSTPGVDVLRRVARGLGVPLSFLLDGG